MEKLTAKERVLLAFQHQEADRVPIFSEARNIGFIERMSGRKLAGTQAEMECITADAYARAGIDLLRRLLTPRWGVVKGEDHDVQWDGYFYWKVGGERVFTLDEALEYVKTRRLGGNGFDPARVARERIAEVNRLQAIFGERALFMPDLGITCLESLYHSVGIENFAIMMYDHADLIDEALETHTQRMIKVVEVVNEIYDGPAIHSCDDLGMKAKTIVAPAWLRAHFFPRMKRVVDAIKAGGKYFSFHTCGNVTAILPDLVAVGIDALDPLEITAGMDLRAVKQQYGERLVIMGNANANIIQMGTSDDVRAEVRRCLDDAAGGGGYLLCGGITPASSAENLVAFFDEARRYRDYRRS